MLLGIDPGCLRLGLAVGKPDDDHPRAWVIRLPGADDVVLSRTLGIAADNVSMYCRSFGVTHVVIEAPIHIPDRSQHTMMALVQLTGAIRAAAWRSKCEVLLVASQSVRKFFVGHGRPENPKRATMERCRLLGWEIADDNAADACAVWSYGVSHFYGKGLHTPLFSKARAA